MSTTIVPNGVSRALQPGWGESSSALSPEERVLALIVYNQSSRMSAAKTQVALNAEQLEKLREQVKQALDQAREAKQDHGFWAGLADFFGGDLASIASAVAAVAAVVATGGAAAAILAAVAAAATLAADHAEELGIPTEVAMVIAITASIAGLCCGEAQGLFKVGEVARGVAKDVKLAGNVAAGAFQIGGAGLGLAAANYERDAQYLQADARAAAGRQELVASDIDAALDDLTAALTRQNRAAQLTSGIQRQSAETHYALLNNWGGAA